MSGDREAMSEQSSSIYEGVGYNEVYLSGRELEEDVTWFQERELSAHSLVEAKEEEDEEGEEGEEEEEGDERGEGLGLG